MGKSDLSLRMLHRTENRRNIDELHQTVKRHNYDGGEADDNADVKSDSKATINGSR